MGGSQSSQEKTQPPPPATPSKSPSPPRITTTTSPQRTTASTSQTINSVTYSRTLPSITTQTNTKQAFISQLRASQSNDGPALQAIQKLTHSANNYFIPAAESQERKDPGDIPPCPDTKLVMQHLRVCPQYNGHGCMAKTCRRLHVCLYWATRTCEKNPCKYDHEPYSVHNTRLIQAYKRGQTFIPRNIRGMVDTNMGKPIRQEEEEICLFSVLKKCTKDPCSRVHSSRTYRWEVKDINTWVQLSYNQSDFLELMYSHPSNQFVDLIPLQTHIANNRNLKKLKTLLSHESSWTVDFEGMQMKGVCLVHDIRRLSTPSDLTSSVPVATRWLWYWQDDAGCWEVYSEGRDKEYSYLALSDHLENVLRIQNQRFTSVDCGRFSYVIYGQKMTQINTTTNKTRKVCRRPACSLVMRKSVKFDELFVTLPPAKKFLKLPVVPLSSEFSFVEGLLNHTMSRLKISHMYRVQNDHLWKVYQNKKRLLVSLYNGNTMATNEQYLFHCTSHNAVEAICQENLDWKLYGTNVGHVYGQGTYFSNKALVADRYGKPDQTGKKVMLVVMVLVGKMTKGHSNMNFPPMNESAGRNYDTTCDSSRDASIFVKYNRDEYYPAYVVNYTCDLAL